jgi:hypothetical protein
VRNGLARTCAHVTVIDVGREMTPARQDKVSTWRASRLMSGLRRPGVVDE